MACSVGIEPVQQLLLSDTSLHLPSHLLSLQDLLSQALLLLNLQPVLPCLLILIRVLWQKKTKHKLTISLPVYSCWKGSHEPLCLI